MELDSDTVTEMFFEMDVSHSGEVDYSEFLSATLAAQTHTDGEIAHAFEMLDQDGDGYITEDDIITALHGTMQQDAIVTALLLHSDSEGRVDLPRFMQLVRAGLQLGSETRGNIIGEQQSAMDNHDVRKSIAVALETRREMLNDISQQLPDEVWVDDERASRGEGARESRLTSGLADPDMLASLVEKSMAKVRTDGLASKRKSLVTATSVATAALARAELNSIANELKSFKAREVASTKILYLASVSNEQWESRKSQWVERKSQWDERKSQDHSKPRSVKFAQRKADQGLEPEAAPASPEQKHSLQRQKSSVRFAADFQADPHPMEC